MSQTMFIQYPLLTLIGAVMVGPFSLATISAFGTGDYLELEKVDISIDESSIDATIETGGTIPRDGKNAFGYGILTGAGNDGIIVSTTHAGMLDSELQTNANDPVWHNHFVKLAKNLSGRCGDNPEVADITMESPGKVKVKENRVIVDGIPFVLDGTSSLTKNPLILAPGERPQQLVSFAIEPKFEGDTLKAVCITNITSAESIDIERRQED
jgi:hypothetical protein